MSEKSLTIHSKIHFEEVKPKIIENRVLANVELGVQEFYDMAEVNAELSKGEPFCLLLEFELMATVSKEFLEIAKSYGKTDGLIATAMIAKNVAHQIAGNAYLKVNKPANLTKMFSNRDKAILWLLEKQQERNV